MVNLYVLTDEFSKTLVEVREQERFSMYRPNVGDVFFFDELPIAKVETVVQSTDSWLVGLDRNISVLIGSSVGIGTP